MQKSVLILALGAALSASLPALADTDVRPDEVVQLAQSGAIRPFDELNRAALARHANSRIHDTELERRGETYVYSVELRDDQGAKWEVDLNAATGEVLRDRRDR